MVFDFRNRILWIPPSTIAVELNYPITATSYLLCHGSTVRYRSAIIYYNRRHSPKIIARDRLSARNQYLISFPLLFDQRRLKSAEKFVEWSPARTHHASYVFAIFSKKRIFLSKWIYSLKCEWIRCSSYITLSQFINL